MDFRDGPYRISDDKSLLSLDIICGLLSRSYWADKRPRDVIAKSIENSLCFGVYHEGKQIGFGRIITDGATLFYLCDVIVDEAYRGMGLGKKLVECMLQAEAIRGCGGVLATRDAQGLYKRFGFTQDEKSYMRKAPE